MPPGSEAGPLARSEDDTWDLASSVGATATLVAAARALATRAGDPLVNDPFAEPLVRAVGIEPFVGALDGDLPDGYLDDARGMLDVIAVRTRFFDDFLLDAATEGIRQAVILAAGLDSRCYRLPWPPDMTVFEIDQPAVIDFKSRVLAEYGAHPATDRRPVAVDLREDWPAAVRRHGFDPAVPTAWIAEGLLVYLPPDAQDRLFDHITALSPAGSRLATEFHPDGGAGIARSTAAISERWVGTGLSLDLGELFYGGERRSVTEYLDQLGWTVDARPRAEMFNHYGRTRPDIPALEKSLFVTATRRRPA